MPIYLLRDVRRIFAGHIEPGRLIVLECAAGAFNTEVAARLGISRPTVGKWRSRFIAHRMDGSVDDPRPGRSATVAAEQVEDVVVATLESTPPNATHWSRAKMAERTGLSKSTVGRIWKAFGLEPHRTDGFKLRTREARISAGGRRRSGRLRPVATRHITCATAGELSPLL
ncbi:helix-turn-helix domain-containing protein [Rhodococcus zopfii]|uniref:helix-turn-helix domain-containing protein n=1 Tax=Rhodococcus zopfii TaxID=43772 RepID=UPI001F11440D|nr:helix-turn-helix domain-containing protein [Rhodococcus zopfii]